MSEATHSAEYAPSGGAIEQYENLTGRRFKDLHKLGSGVEPIVSAVLIVGDVIVSELRHLGNLLGEKDSSGGDKREVFRDPL